MTENEDNEEVEDDEEDQMEVEKEVEVEEIKKKDGRTDQDKRKS